MIENLFKEKLSIKKWNSESLLAFFILFILGTFIYYGQAVHEATNADGYYYAIGYKFISEGMVSGRFGITIADVLMGRIVSPVFSVIISCAIYSTIVIIIADLFEWKKLGIYTLLSGLLLFLMPGTSSMFMYYYCMIDYSIAFLFAILGVYITIKSDRVGGVLVSSILIAGACSIYQAYISVAMNLTILWGIWAVFKKLDKKYYVGKIIRVALAALSGVVLYLVFWKFYPFTLPDGARFEKTETNTIIKIFSSVFDSYKNFYNYFVSDAIICNSFMFRNFVNALIIISSITLLILLIIKMKIYKNIFELIFVVMLVAVLPLCSEIITVLASNDIIYGTTGILVVPGMWLVYVFLTLLISICCESKSISRQQIIVVPCFLLQICLIWGLVFYTAATNQLSIMNSNRARSISDTILCKIIDDGLEYKKDSKILVVGNGMTHNFEPDEITDRLLKISKGTLPYYGIVWEGYNGTKTWSTIINKCECSYHFSEPDESDYDEVIQSDEFKNMDYFPNGNCIKVFKNGIYVVKLGDI